MKTFSFMRQKQFLSFIIGRGRRICCCHRKSKVQKEAIAQKEGSSSDGKGGSEREDEDFYSPHRDERELAVNAIERRLTSPVGTGLKTNTDTMFNQQQLQQIDIKKRISENYVIPNLRGKHRSLAINMAIEMKKKGTLSGGSLGDVRSSIQ